VAARCVERSEAKRTPTGRFHKFVTLGAFVATSESPAAVGNLVFSKEMGTKWEGIDKTSNLMLWVDGPTNEERALIFPSGLNESTFVVAEGGVEVEDADVTKRSVCVRANEAKTFILAMV
jgi:hypothetical protein